MKSYRNSLATESSPYLLQHAQNPVAWQAWDENLLHQGSLLIVSIGYSACHWCHVMEHECFEDEEVAQLMNESFINIKVDREERPDIDHIYMQALQVMTGHGGWPLNVVCLPDGRPIWGGTYVPKKQWMGVLRQLRDLYKDSPEQMEVYAEKLRNGLAEVNKVVTTSDETDINEQLVHTCIEHAKTTVDHKNGGLKGAPKFPMPNNLQLLLHYASVYQDQELIDFVELSLTKMIWGGIYDTLGGGFSRYSVDEHWHIPHFEKMLYDNAQLIDLLSDTYKVTQNELFLETINQTIAFIETHWKSPDGGYFSAMDADSQTATGNMTEGAFYTWEKADLESILTPEEASVMKTCYNVNPKGYWENNQYVFLQTESHQANAAALSLSLTSYCNLLTSAKEKLYQHRKKRSLPLIDTKVISSWNALLVTAYCKASTLNEEQTHLEKAKNCFQFLMDSRLNEDGSLIRLFRKKETPVEGCLDDYAFMIEAGICLYEHTFDEKYLLAAEKMMAFCLENFLNESKNAFYYKAASAKQLFVRSIEREDNVIPSSNSTMAKNLFKLGRLSEDETYVSLSKKMLQDIQEQFKSHFSPYSNWLQLYLQHAVPFYVIKISPDVSQSEKKSLQSVFLPQAILTTDNQIPKKSLMCCTANACYPSETKVEAVLKSINSSFNKI